ncbi:MAG TPA: hypothetical protein PKV59_08905, partial [Flexilinea sp.]|nr:hypothetical protein [Flexilinea sp.]
MANFPEVFIRDPKRQNPGKKAENKFKSSAPDGLAGHFIHGDPNLSVQKGRLRNHASARRSFSP